MTHHPSPTFSPTLPHHTSNLSPPPPPPLHHHHLDCSENQSFTQIYLLQTPVIGARIIKFNCGPSTLKKKRKRTFTFSLCNSVSVSLHLFFFKLNRHLFCVLVRACVYVWYNDILMRHSWVSCLVHLGSCQVLTTDGSAMGSAALTNDLTRPDLLWRPAEMPQSAFNLC